MKYILIAQAVTVALHIIIGLFKPDWIIWVYNKGDDKRFYIRGLVLALFIWSLPSLIVTYFVMLIYRVIRYIFET